MKILSILFNQSTFLIVVRLISTVFGFLTLRFLSQRMLASDFDIFVIIKQITGWFIALGFLGMATALPRTMVAHQGRIPPKLILLCAFALIIPGILLPLSLAAANPSIFSFWIFRSAEWADVVRPFAVLTCALAWLSLLTLYLRGVSCFRSAVLLEMAGFSIIPFIFIFTLSPPLRVAHYLWWTSLTLLLSLLAYTILIYAKKNNVMRVDSKDLRLVFKELLNFGMPKLLSGAYQMTILGILPIALRWAGADLRTAAATTLGMSLGVTVSAIVTTPISLVTFKDLIMSHLNERDGLKDQIAKLIKLGVVGGLALSVLGGLGTNLVVYYLIGPVYEAYAAFMNAGAFIGFLFFTISVVETPLDGVRPPWEKAKISLMILVATLATLFLIIHFRIASPALVIGVIGCSVFCFAVSLSYLATRIVDANISFLERVWRPLMFIAAAGLLYFFLKKNFRSREIEIASFILFSGGITVLLQKSGILTMLLSEKPLTSH